MIVFVEVAFGEDHFPPSAKIDSDIWWSGELNRQGRSALLGGLHAGYGAFETRRNETPAPDPRQLIS